MRDQSGHRYRYTILLPPGWTRIPVRDGADEAIDNLLDLVLEPLPKNLAAPQRARLKRLFGKQLVDARKAGGLDLYLSITPPGNPVAPASFVVAHQYRGPSVAGADETAVLNALLQKRGPAARPLELDGSPAIRIERHATEKAGSLSELDIDQPLPTRRVTYVVNVPSGGGWLMATFTTLRATEEVRRPGVRSVDDALVELFDAVMGTFRWSSE